MCAYPDGDYFTSRGTMQPKTSDPDAGFVAQLSTMSDDELVEYLRPWNDDAAFAACQKPKGWAIQERSADERAASAELDKRLRNRW